MLILKHADHFTCVLHFTLSYKLQMNTPICFRGHMLNFWKFSLVCIHKNKDKKDTERQSENR